MGTLSSMIISTRQRFSKMSLTKTSWYDLPPEIRNRILEVLMQDGCSLASAAAVNRDWQTPIEHHTFARINLTPHRLVSFREMVHRNRALVHHIHLNLGLHELRCISCSPDSPWYLYGVMQDLEQVVQPAFVRLALVLSAWVPGAPVVLDFSAHPGPHAEHWYARLTYPPIASSGNLMSENVTPETMQPVEPDEGGIPWVPRRLEFKPRHEILYRVFEKALGVEPSGEVEETMWWFSFPTWSPSG